MNELTKIRRSKLGSAFLVAAMASLSGCAIYHRLPLPNDAHLARSVTQLNGSIPSTPGARAIELKLDQALSPDTIGMLAVLNNPTLMAQHGELDAATARLISATLLPNPAISYSDEALKSGPASSSSISASISEDIRSIITYHPRAEAARSRLKAVKANLMWQEWQVAQKARLLAVQIFAGRRQLDIRQHELDIVNRELVRVRAATRAGNLDLSAEAPLLAAQASADIAIASARMQLLKYWQALDALLGLAPTVRFPVVNGANIAIPKHLSGLIASLPSRRPDLVALRLGYQAADADVRAAVIGQFPAFSLGFSHSSDTSDVVSAGPVITMDLPIFDRNQGEIALARATRLKLHALYQARLDQADGHIASLLARRQAIIVYLKKASAASREASSHAIAALAAYKQGNLSQRDVTDYETTALERQLNVTDYSRALTETNLALLIELGAGFPDTILMSPDQAK